MKNKYNYDILKKFDIFSLNYVNVKYKGNVLTKYDKNNKNKFIEILGNTPSENYIIIPNLDYNQNGLKINANEYILYYKFNIKNSFGFMFNFIYKDNDKNIQILLNFKYPFFKLNSYRTKKNKYEINIPINIEIHNNNDILKEFLIEPLQIIKDNFKDLNMLNNSNCLFLRYIKIYGNIQLFNIFIKENNLNLTNRKNSFNNSKENLIENNKNNDLINSSLLNKKNNKMNNSENNESTTKFNTIPLKEKKVKKESGEKENLNESSNFEELLNEKLDKVSNLDNNKDSLINLNKINDIDKISKNNLFKQEIRTVKLSEEISSISGSEKNNNLFSSSKLSIQSGLLLNSNSNKNITKNEFQLDLKYIKNFSSKICPEFKIIKNIELNNNFLFFISNNVLISLNIEKNSQKFFYTNDNINPITNLLLLNNGENCIVFQNKFIYIFDLEKDKPINNIKTNLNDIHILQSNVNNSLLLLVGDNEINKDIIILYDIKDLNNVVLFSQQIFPYSVLDMKFDNSTYNLISCGKSNIRLYNIKNNCLIGKNFNIYNNKNKILNIKRGEVFINIFFDKLNLDFIYVFSKKGFLLYLNINDMNIKKIYEIEKDFNINNSYINNKYLIIGNSGGFLKFWNINVNNFTEKNYEIIIKNINENYSNKEDNFILYITQEENNLNENDIFYSTINSEIIKFNITTKENIKIFSTNKNMIKNIYYNKKYLVILNIDGSFNIYDNNKNFSDIFYYKIKNEKASKILLNENNLNNLIVGYDSGIIRIFDIELKSILKEFNTYKNKAKITFLKLIRDNQILMISNSKGEISFNEIKNDYMIIKQLFINSNNNKKITLTYDNERFSFFIKNKENIFENNIIYIYNLNSFSIFKTLIINEENFIKKFIIIYKNIICVLFSNYFINFYNLKGKLIKRLENNIFLEDVYYNFNNIFITNNFNYLILTEKNKGNIIFLKSNIIYNKNLNFKIYNISKSFNDIFFNNENGELFINEDNIIKIYHFKGEIMFSDQNIIKEFENIKENEYVNELQEKNLTQYFIDTTNNDNEVKKINKTLKNENKRIYQEKNLLEENDNKINNNENNPIIINKNEDINQIKKESNMKKLDGNLISDNLTENEFEFISDKNYLELNKYFIDDDKEKRISQKLYIFPNLHYKPERHGIDKE